MLQKFPMALHYPSYCLSTTISLVVSKYNRSDSSKLRAMDSVCHGDTPWSMYNFSFVCYFSDVQLYLLHQYIIDWGFLTCCWQPCTNLQEKILRHPQYSQNLQCHQSLFVRGLLMRVQLSAAEEYTTLS